MKSPFAVFAVALVAFAAGDLKAQETAPTPTPPPIVVPAAAVRVTDPAAATRAWLDTVPADKRQRSDAYFEGGYWLLLWNFLLSAAISLLLLQTRLSARMRDFAERTTRFKTLQVALYAVPYLLITSALAFPLTYYESFVREHAYQMATQTFGAWMGDQLKELMLGLIAMPLVLMALYAVFRKAPRTWWIWGTGVVLLVFMFGALIGPVFVEPLFNKYKPLDNPAISEPILVLARANQIPVKQVFEVDASRQTKRVSANVAGFLGTMRIALNDNLLQQCTLPEIRYVMAHEMGHYVLNHIVKFIIAMALMLLAVFALARLIFDWAVRHWGARWSVRGIGDPAGLPLLMLVFAALSFVLTPLRNTMIRTSEIEADAFGINAAREPDGMAAVSLKLGAYRKLDPSPAEEFIFFDHPSGRARIRMAMDWKAANQDASTIR
ncbi:MAG: M48 family metallopeptidase [Verrucomicrobiota bacterium]|nr:M48 family metallopeptidase [Verrucomicrobiota bacterium]